MVFNKFPFKFIVLTFGVKIVRLFNVSISFQLKSTTFTLFQIILGSMSADHSLCTLSHSKISSANFLTIKITSYLSNSKNSNSSSGIDFCKNDKTVCKYISKPTRRSMSLVTVCSFTNFLCNSKNSLYRFCTVHVTSPTFTLISIRNSNATFTTILDVTRHFNIYSVKKFNDRRQSDFNEL
ncbi:hypothetical protein AGLY_003823 [Aphis glycines]|uniref:Uncharacterized protein n=1 Tax=Aphis glycines TaxID=307491 RepID=A0A6G0TZF7_APHGL|nr:hypothetical protein AGLY_003823 [Aphis glycines]